MDGVIQAHDFVNEVAMMSAARYGLSQSGPAHPAASSSHQSSHRADPTPHMDTTRREIDPRGHLAALSVSGAPSQGQRALPDASTYDGPFGHFVQATAQSTRRHVLPPLIISTSSPFAAEIPPGAHLGRAGRGQLQSNIPDSQSVQQSASAPIASPSFAYGQHLVAPRLMYAAVPGHQLCPQGLPSHSAAGTPVQGSAGDASRGAAFADSAPKRPNYLAMHANAGYPIPRTVGFVKLLDAQLSTPGQQQKHEASQQGKAGSHRRNRTAAYINMSAQGADGLGAKRARTY